MAVTLAVFQNGDDALLVWNVGAAIPGCRGFAVRRELTRAGKKHATWLDNYVGFAGKPHKRGEKRRSTVWPFQQFAWTDHEVSAGDSVRYRVVPVVRAADGKLKRLTGEQSAWSVVAPAGGSPFRAFFNRGYVMSQFMAQYLAQSGKTLEQFKDTIRDKDDRTIRHFLSGDLRVQMLRLLDGARTRGEHVYAALFELTDHELIDGLKALGPRAHVVLANGSISPKNGETAAQARKRDGNAEARATLVAAGADVETGRRFTSPGALAHNKFLVVTDPQGAPRAAWTGSTNWAPTGLCTQLNNGLLIEDAAIADQYLRQWHRLRAAGNAFPASLKTANSSPRTSGDATVWFTRTNGRADLKALTAEVDRARQSILCLMFMPGGKGLLPAIQRREREPGLFVRGVISELPDPKDESVVEVTILGDGKPFSRQLNIIEPAGFENAIAYWAAEVTRSQFLGRVGHAIIHSKVVVIDPLSDDPTVITGSHNFSESASARNDENFMIIRGDRALAQAYMVNIIGAYRHYRARTKRSKPYLGLKDDDKWMAGALAARKRDRQLWGF
ncbi:MAG: phospholipase D-like domain-containing protein [Solirubrobacterales bacterium]